MQKLRKILILGLVAATFALSQGIYGAQIEIDTELPLDSQFSILIDANTGHILHSVNAHERAYPASMTKVMTALLLLESNLDASTPIIHSHAAISDVMPWHSGFAYVDETLTVEEALYAIMLASANDTSNAIAELLGGTMENFARMMTARAHELGAVNTNFTNAHGLWEAEHFTTAYDMALIMLEALRHDKFRDVIATQDFIIPPSINYDEYRIIYNTNRMILPNTRYFSPDIVGGKTGFTNNSRHTLVSYGQRGDMQLVSVIMAADQRQMMFTDTQMLMDFGFEQFRHHTAFTAGSFSEVVDLVQRSGEGVFVIGNIEVYAKDDIVLSLPINFETNSITTEVLLPNRIIAPVAENFALGRVLIVFEGNVLAETTLLAAHAGYPLNERDLAALLPGGGAVGYTYVVTTDGDNVTMASTILNIILATFGTIIFAFVMLRFLQFSHRSRRRKSLGKYRGYRGYSGPYRASMSDLKFKYRYK